MANPAEKARVHLIIRGLVQGVAFRFHTQAQAEALGVCGWVRNLEDGDVEALAEGPKEAVDRFVRWCHLGPRSARVDEVLVDREAFVGEFTRFSIAPS